MLLEILMVPLVLDRLDELSALCLEFGVSRLELFGSAASGDFDADKSDLDFLVTYPDEHDLGPWMSRHLELERRLEHMFARPVELVLARKFRNPYFARSVEQTRQILYAAEVSQTSVGFM